MFSLKTHLALSASTFLEPGMCFADKCILLLMTQSQIFFAILWHSIDLASSLGSIDICYCSCDVGTDSVPTNLQATTDSY